MVRNDFSILLGIAVIGCHRFGRSPMATDVSQRFSEVIAKQQTLCQAWLDWIVPYENPLVNSQFAIENGHL